MKLNLEMQKKYGKVAVLMGGISAEREISLKSGAAVLKALQEQGVDAYAFDPKDGLEKLLANKPDHVWNALHGRGGEDGQIQGFMQMNNIPYSGCGVMASALAMDKLRTKLVWKSLGLPVANHAMVETGELLDEDAKNLLESLNGCAMVKPIREGSSVGMAKAETIEQLQVAVSNASEFDNEIMLEQWIDGDEFTVAVLEDKALPSIHMTTPNNFYDFNAKYQSDTTEYHCPSGLSESDESELGELALKSFTAVAAQGWSRVDFLRDRKTKEWFLLEINTIPGMTESSLVPKAAKVAGISFQELVLKVLDTSLITRK